MLPLSRYVHYYNRFSVFRQCLLLDSRRATRYYFLRSRDRQPEPGARTANLQQYQIDMTEQLPPAAVSPERPEIDYPCTWVYKVIGEDIEILKELIITACAPARVAIAHSHSSSGGKYHSLNATLEVDSEQMRLQIYDLLKTHPAVKIVL